MSNDIDISVDGLGEITIEDKTLERNESSVLYNYNDRYNLDLLANELEDFSSFVEWQSSDSINVFNSTSLDTTAKILSENINFYYRTYIKGEENNPVIAVVLTFDKSGSMSNDELTQTANSINSFIDEGANDSDVTLYYAIVEYGAEANVSTGSDFIEATSTSQRASSSTTIDTSSTNYEKAMEKALELYKTTSIDLSNATKSIVHTSDGNASFDQNALVTIDGVEKSYSEHALDNGLNYIYSLVIYQSVGNEGMKNISRMIHSESEILVNEYDKGYYRTNVVSNESDSGQYIGDVYSEIYDTVKYIYIYQTFLNEYDNDDFKFTSAGNNDILLANIASQAYLESKYPTLDINTCNIITEIKNIESARTIDDLEITPGLNISYDDTIDNILAKSLITYNQYYIKGIFQNDGYVLTINKNPSEAGSINVSSNPHPNSLPDSKYGYFNKGEVIDIEAVTNTGYEFREWVRDINDTSPTQQITMDEDKSLEAYFNKLGYTLDVNILPEDKFGSYSIEPKKDIYETDENITVSGIENKSAVFDRLEYDTSTINNISTNGMQINFNIVGNTVIDYYFDPNLYKVNIEIVGEGDVSVTPNPGDLTEPDYGNYYYNDNIAIEAINSVTGWEFSHWELDIESESQIEYFNIKEDKNIKAVFVANEYKLLAETYGNGEILLEEVDVHNPLGDIQSNYINRNYSKNDVVNLTYIDNNDCWYFDSWIEDIESTNKTEEVVIDSNKHIVADFNIRRYSIDKNIIGNGRIELSPSNNKYECGDLVEVTAIPDKGYKFDHWEDDLNISTNPESINIYENKNITAVFTKKKYTLDLTINGTGNVDVTPSKTEYSYGDEVTLQAEGVGDSNFVSYTYKNKTPEIVSTDRYQNIVMNEDRNITVLFEDNEYILTVETVGQGNVEITPEKDVYSAGDLIELEVISEDNWMFYTWSSSPELNLEDSNESFNITEDTHITAYFKRGVDKSVNYELINNRYKGMVESYKFNKQNHQTELNIDKIENYYESINSLIENINNNLDEHRVLKRRLLSLKEKIKRLYKGDY